jgi:hypothetical protein
MNVSLFVTRLSFYSFSVGTVSSWMMVFGDAEWDSGVHEYEVTINSGSQHFIGVIPTSWTNYSHTSVFFVFVLLSVWLSVVIGFFVSLWLYF